MASPGLISREKLVNIHLKKFLGEPITYDCAVYELVRITGNGKDINPGDKVRGSTFVMGTDYCFILKDTRCKHKGS